jgi:hypothetical protein
VVDGADDRGVVFDLGQGRIQGIGRDEHDDIIALFRTLDTVAYYL